MMLLLIRRPCIVSRTTLAYFLFPHLLKENVTTYPQNTVVRLRYQKFNQFTWFYEYIQKTKIMASSPITPWEIDGETVETVSDFIFGGSKITADGDCSHEIKRRLLLG